MSKKAAKVGDIMTREVITFGPEDSLILAAELFEKYNFDGFPVVDQKRRLLGILTAYDMVLQSSKIHLPMIFSLLKQIDNKEIDEKVVEAHFSKIREVKIQEVMNIDPLIVTADVGVDDLANEFVEHHSVNPIPVVDKDRRLLGVVSRYDVIRFFNQKFLDQVIQGPDHGGILKRLTQMDE